MFASVIKSGNFGANGAEVEDEIGVGWGDEFAIATQANLHQNAAALEAMAKPWQMEADINGVGVHQLTGILIIGPRLEVGLGIGKFSLEMIDHCCYLASGIYTFCLFSRVHGHSPQCIVVKY